MGATQSVPSKLFAAIRNGSTVDVKVGSVMMFA